MSRPPDESTTTRISRMAEDIRRQRTHTHPGIPSDPATITGPRSDISAILGQILDALSAAEYIIDETTDD